MAILREKQDPIWENLRRNIGILGQAALQERMLEKRRKTGMEDIVKKALIENILGGKVQAPEGFDLNQMIQTGQMPDIGGFTPTPRPPTVSITQTERPLSEVLAAEGILSAPEKELAKQGLLKKTGGGFLGSGSRYEETPALVRLREKAQEVVSGPRLTKRLSGKGIVPFGTQTQNLNDLKPANVSQEDWDAATDEEKREFLNQLGLL